MDNKSYELYVNFSENVLKYKLDTLIECKRELGYQCNADNPDYKLLEEQFATCKFLQSDLVDSLHRFTMNTDWKPLLADFKDTIASSLIELEYHKLFHQYLYNEELPINLG